MRIYRPKAILILLLVLLLPAGSFAVCIKSEPNWLWNYEGAIGEGDGYRVRATLIFNGEQVSGLYFYASQLRDIKIQGVVKNGTDITLDELDVQDKVTARFEGRFVESDPRGKFRGSKLECEVIVGFWQKQGSADRMPIYLSMESGTAGSLTNRYINAGADDDELIHRNARRFWNYVKQGDKAGVASLVAYPVKVNLPSGMKRLRNSSELIANYDAIFSPRYREAVSKALPRNMFVRDQGIMLGNGEVWFGPDGKVISLNHF